MGTHINTISALTAMVAVIVGPVVSFIIAKRQIIASTVTTGRQRWISDFRDAVADFNAKASMIYGLAGNHYADEHSIPRIEELVKLNYRIELLVDPNEEDHAMLVKIVDSITSSLKEAMVRGEVGEDLDHKKEQLVLLAQKILRNQRERVSKGEQVGI